jgi:phosphatidylinositol alpha-mannosyltransferase
VAGASKRRLKIALVTEFYYPTLGGIQEHVHHFAIEAQKRGHAVQIITSHVADLAPAEVGAPVPVVRLGRSVRFFANESVGRMTLARGLGDRLGGLLERGRFDIVHIHAPLTPTLPLLALARSTSTTIGTFHANFPPLPLGDLVRRIGRRYMQRLDGAIAVSPTAAAAAARYFPGDYEVIPNGVDVERFAPDIARARSDRFTVLWVGRMEPRNGLDRLISAFVLAAACRDDLQLSVVGDGPLRARYEAMVPPELRAQVAFHGAVNGARPTLYAAADLLCVPTTIASFGVTLLEGMSAGKPIVASDIEGFRDVLTHEAEGLLVDTADPVALAGAILRLAADRELATALGTRGRATAERYAWPRVAERVLAYYETVLLRTRRAEVAG